MKRTLLVLAIAALALPATALAKGPSEAKIDGPGLGKAITISQAEQNGFAEISGFFGQAFDQTPSPLLPSRPKGDLGPKYSIDYTVPGPNGETWQIDADLYPYAKPYAVTYMASGQKIFDFETHGGWFQDPRLKETLVAAGLPANPVADTSESSSFSAGRIGALAGLAALLIAIGSVVVMRRRRPGPAA